jgi:hypothetical protein
MRLSEFATRNTLFMNEHVRRSVGRTIERHHTDVRDYFLALRKRGVLVLAGSIARGEPSICMVDHGEPILRSDYDWVLIEPGVESGVHEELQDLLVDMFPDANDTVYTLPLESVKKLFSASARDMWMGLANPVCSVGCMDMRWISCPELRPVHAIEVIVYHIVAVLLSCYENNPDASVADRDGSVLVSQRRWSQTSHRLCKIKLAAESLRMASILTAEKDECATFRSAYTMMTQGELRTLGSDRHIRRILQARELDYGIWDPEFEEVVATVRGAIRLLHPSDGESDPELLSAIRIEVLPQQHVLHQFPLVALGAILGGGDPLREREICAAIMVEYDAVRGLRDRVFENCWAYLEAILQHKDQGGQLDAIE